MIGVAGSFHINALPFDSKPAAETALRFYTMSRRRDWLLQRLWAAVYRPRTTSTPDNTSSSFALGSLPTRSVNSDLSSVTICETFATDSLGSPVAVSDRRTFPGADAHFTLLVSATQTAVEMRLRFRLSP
jgi:hypothetical protein